MVKTFDHWDGSFFSTLECELLRRRSFCSLAEARMACFTSIEGFYDPLRLHSGLGYPSPIDYERTFRHARLSPMTSRPERVH